MSRQVRKAKKFVRGRRFITAALITMVAVGFGAFTGTSFLAQASGTTINGDATCGSYSNASTQFTESTVMNWAQVNGNGLGATFSAYANDENDVLLGVNGATGMTSPLTSVPQHASNLSGGDPSVKLGDGQPYYPSLYLTKVSGPGSWTKPGDATPQEPGDFQQGGTPRNISNGSNAGSLASGTPYVNDAYGDWITGTVSTGNNGQVGTLTNSTPLSTTANTTTLQVSATTQAIGSGDSLTLSQSGHTQTNWKTTAAYPIGTTSITVMGQKANFGYSSGATVVDTKLVTAAGTYTRSTLPSKNDNNFGTGSDAPTDTGGASALHDEGYGVELRWNVSGLSAFNPSDSQYEALQPGSWYKVQVLDNDGDQNHTGGDTGEFCTLIKIPGPPPIHTDPTGGNSITGPNLDGHIKQWVGTTIKDTAFVPSNAGFGIPTGTVTFNLYFDAGNAPTTCAHATDTPPGNLVYTDTETLDSSADPAHVTSGATTPGYNTAGHGLGTYYWQDTFNPSGSNAGNYTSITEACAAETDQMVDARVRLTPHSAYNIIGNPHTLHAVAETKAAGDAGWTQQPGELIDSTLNSGTNAFYTGASASATPPGSCTTASGMPAVDDGLGTSTTMTTYCNVTINDNTAEDVLINATSNVVVTGVTGGTNGDDSITESTNNGAACTADDVSGVPNGILCEAIKHYINPKTQLTVQDQLIGLGAGATGTVTYTAWKNDPNCTAGAGTSEGGGTITSGTVPLSSTVTVTPGSSTTTWYFEATYVGNEGTFTTSCTAEQASSG